MSKETKDKNVPKLRFPEFKEAGEWEVNVLGGEGISYFVKKKVSKDRLRLDTYISTENLLSDYAGATHASKLPSSGSFTQFKKGDILLSNIRPYLKKVWKSNIDGTASNDVIVIRASTSVNDSFLAFLLINDDFINYVMKGAKGVKMPRGDKSLMEEYPIIIPKKEEQQKIASCLSSLDELIAAENQKLDALKTHKKGLMQQLFPADASTGSACVPKLRFAEFRESGEWEYRNISDFSKVTTGNRDTQNKVDDGLYPFFVRSQTVERINSFSFDGEAILTSGDGVGVGKNFHYINGKFDFHQRVYCIYNFNKNVSGKFVFHYFSEHFYKRVMQLSAKNSVDSVRMSMITDMSICLPSIKEQQKIDSFLSSLDELIAAQSQKTEALKVHKKGLMQGLFPAMSEQ